MRALFLLVAAALGAGCAAAPPEPGPAAAASFDADLADRFVAERRWADLFALHGEARGAEDMRSSLDWSRDRLLNGGTIFIGLPYAANLWRVAETAPPESPLRELKETGAIVGLYGLAVILVDGHRCADPTSPNERAADWIASFRDPFHFAAALPQDRREKLIETAMRLESAIAPRRGNDFWLCGAGMKRVEAALAAMKEKGGAPREVPPPVGASGRAFVLPEAPGWSPGFVDRAEAAPKEEVARRSLPNALAELLDRIAEVQPS